MNNFRRSIDHADLLLTGPLVRSCRLRLETLSLNTGVLFTARSCQRGEILKGAFLYCCVATMKDGASPPSPGGTRTACSRPSPRHLSGLKGLAGKWSVNKETVWQLH